jgi:hypothetical protein
MLAALGVMLLLLGEFAVRELALRLHVSYVKCECEWLYECVSGPKQYKYPLKLHNHEG